MAALLHTFNWRDSMKHPPLTRWTCDTCGLDVVADEEADNGGYVNWGRCKATP